MLNLKKEKMNKLLMTVLLGGFFLFLPGMILAQEQKAAVAAMAGPEGNLIFWQGPILHPSQPVLEGWVGYHLYRQRASDQAYSRITETPIIRAPLEEFQKALGAEAMRLASVLGLNSPEELWQAFINGNEKLVRLASMIPVLRPLFGLSFLDSQTAADTACFYRVVMVKKDGSESSPLGSASTTKPSLIGPAQIRAEQDADLVRITWKPNSADKMVAGYFVYRASDPQAYFTRLTRQPVLLAVSEAGEPRGEFTDRPGQPLRIFYYRVTSVDIAGNESPPGEPVNILIRDLIPPAAPRNVQAHLAEDGIRLTWEAVADDGLLGYYVYRSDSREAAPQRISSQLVPAAEGPEFVDLFVQPKVLFFYSVTVVDRAGNESEPSSVEQAIQEILFQPSAPDGVKAEAKDNKIVIIWTPSTEEDILGYYVFRSEKPEAEPSLLSPILSPETKSYEVAGPDRPSGRFVWYWLKTVHRSGAISALSAPAIIFTPDVRLPLKPRRFRGFAEDRSVKLFWEVPEDRRIAGFILFRRRGERGEFLCLTPEPLKAKALHQYTDAGLEAGDTLAYYLVSIDRAGNRSEPTPVVELSLDVPLPPPPANLRWERTGGGIRLSWDRLYVDDASGYVVYRKEGNSGWTRITPIPLPLEITEFLDKTPLIDADRSYSLVTISIRNNEGRRSKEISVSGKKFP